MRNHFVLPTEFTLANLANDPRMAESGKANAEWHTVVTDQADASLNWKDLAWLKSLTHLPIVIKGILTAEDAVLAAHHGASGIMVGNHGEF